MIFFSASLEKAAFSPFKIPESINMLILKFACWRQDIAVFRCKVHSQCVCIVGLKFLQHIFKQVWLYVISRLMLIGLPL